MTRRVYIALFGAALAASIAMSMTHGVAMEVYMGLAGALWIAVIVIGKRRV
jgi:hypothetical protein